MKITGVEEQKKNKKRFNIYIDDAFFSGLDEEIVYRYNLKEGMTINKETLENIIMKEEQIKANNYALSYISRALKTEHQLKTKMKEKGYEESIINNTIEMLKKYNYLNDENYAKSYANDKSKLSKHGKNKIKMDLIRKGVDKETIDNVLLNIDFDDEIENALTLANKKLGSYAKHDKFTQKRKLYGFLQSKGYNYSVINTVLNEIFSD